MPVTINGTTGITTPGLNSAGVTLSSGALTFSDTTTQSTAGAISSAASGYQRLPSGIIIQWGEYTATMSHTVQYTATFPIAFPNACRQVVAYVGPTVTTGVTPVTCPFVSSNTTTFTFQYGTVNGAAYATTVHYIAIGY